MRMDPKVEVIDDDQFFFEVVVAVVVVAVQSLPWLPLLLAIAMHTED